VRDVAGAGDTFLAALAVKYGETSNISTAIKFANKMAMQVVQQRGVTTCKASHYRIAPGIINYEG
jgi:sugar/nucleoside kinase (ribokinase family)